MKHPVENLSSAHEVDINLSSRHLVSARQTATALDGFPGILPETLEQAYALQSLSIKRFGKPVAGWKVGMVPANYRDKFDDIRLAGPIFEDVVHRDTGGVTDMPVFSGGFAAVEAEVLVELSCDIEPGSFDTGQRDVRDAVRNVYTGTEIASSPMADINVMGPMAIISDFGNNHGLIIGRPVPDWQNVRDEDIPVSVEIDGKMIAEGTSANTMGGYMAAVKFLIELMTRRDMVLSEGTFISTGAVTGVHDALPGSHSRVGFGHFGEMEMKLSPFRP